MEALIKLARTQAQKVHRTQKSFGGFFRLGSVLFDKRQVINVGRNDINKTHPKSKTAFNKIHAEFDAIIGVEPYLLHGSSLLVVRLDAHDNLTLAKPCGVCEKLIKSVGIKNLFYSNEKGRITHERLSVAP